METTYSYTNLWIQMVSVLVGEPDFGIVRISDRVRSNPVFAFRISAAFGHDTRNRMWRPEVKLDPLMI